MLFIFTVPPFPAAQSSNEPVVSFSDFAPSHAASRVLAGSDCDAAGRLEWLGTVA